METETNLIRKVSAEHLELEAGWIFEVVAEDLSSQEDAHLHHLLQNSGSGGLNGDFIEQLYHEKIKIRNTIKLCDALQCKKCVCVLTGLSSTSGEITSASSFPLSKSSL